MPPAWEFEVAADGFKQSLHGVVAQSTVLGHCIDYVIGAEQQLYVKRSCVLQSCVIHNGAKGEVLETSASEPPPCGVIRVLANAFRSAESYHDTLPHGLTRTFFGSEPKLNIE